MKQKLLTAFKLAAQTTKIWQTSWSIYRAERAAYKNAVMASDGDVYGLNRDKLDQASELRATRASLRAERANTFRSLIVA